jgi:L,D-transpeptidase catalytic domain
MGVMALALGALPAAARGQAEPVPAPPQPAPAKLDLSVARLVKSKGTSVARLGSRIRVRGLLTPYAEGQVVGIEVTRNGRRVLTRQLQVRRVPGQTAGRVLFGFSAKVVGRYVVSAFHPGTPALGPAGAPARRFRVRYPSVSPGERSSGARLLQSLLARRGFAVPRSGVFDAGTARAVLAFRKVNGMRRITTAGRRVFSKLAKGGGFRLRYPRAGKHVEVDISRQVMALARGSRVLRTYSVSTGRPGLPTVRGRFRFYWHSPGYNAKGMFYSIYFHRGYAVHGYASVPIYPASHGCVRVPIPNAISIYRWIRNGDRIDVYL